MPLLVGGQCYPHPEPGFSELGLGLVGDACITDRSRCNYCSCSGFDHSGRGPLLVPNRVCDQSRSMPPMHT